jgi:hypothetical protein
MLCDISSRLIRIEEKFLGLPTHQNQSEIYLQKRKKNLIISSIYKTEATSHTSYLIYGVVYFFNTHVLFGLVNFVWTCNETNGHLV